jgi:hypothetical protein
MMARPVGLANLLPFVPSTAAAAVSNVPGPVELIGVNAVSFAIYFLPFFDNTGAGTMLAGNNDTRANPPHVGHIIAS